MTTNYAKPAGSPRAYRCAVIGCREWATVWDVSGPSWVAHCKAHEVKQPVHPDIVDPDQGDLFGSEVAKGRVLRDEGLARVQSPEAQQAYRDECYRVGVEWAAQRREFTMDDIRNVVGEPPGDARIMGAVAKRLLADGLVEKLGYGQHTRASSHASPQMRYRGRG